MNRIFESSIAGDLHGFLQFKRSLGFRYARAEFTLREFDRFLVASAHKRLPLDQAAIEWLSGKPGRKPVSVSGDAAVLRQLFAFLRRSPDRAITEPRWPKLPTESVFVPYFLSEQDVLKLVALCAGLDRPRFRASLYRALLLVLYCTGIRFGEALRLRIRDSRHAVRSPVCRYVQGSGKMGSVSPFLGSCTRPLSDRAGEVRADGPRRPVLRRRQ